MPTVSGRTALVTGGGRGLGAAISRELGRLGATVLVNDLDQERADSVVAEIRALGGTATPAVADVTDLQSIEAVIERDAKDGVDILINNAGIPPDGIGAGPFAGSTPGQWKRMIDLNLGGVLNCVHAVLGGMVAREYGRIITMVSDSARIGEPNMAVYSAAKAASAAFSRSLAKEVGSSGITCNCVSLGSLVTERLNPDLIPRMAKRYPAGRLGQPEDVVPVILLFASDEASWITGQTYGVNGGYSMS